ncbi:MAG TPA: hypothetical protein VF255_01925 [Solirubrobacterales bacterium]
MIRRTVVALALALATCAALATSVSAAPAPAWRVAGVTGPTNLPPVTSEVQQVAVDAAAGTFTLSFEGQETGPLEFDAGAAELESALDALSTIAGSGGDVRVSGGPGNPGAELPYFVSFGGDLAGVDVPQLTANASGLGGGSATVTTVMSGAPVGSGELAVFPTNIGGAPTGSLPAPPTIQIGPLPQGIVTAGPAHGTGSSPKWSCTTTASEATCEYTDSIAPLTIGEPVAVPLQVESALAPPSSTVEVSVSGGGAATGHVHDVPIVVSSTPAEPGIQAFWAGAFKDDGSPETRAGSHPYSAGSLFLRNTILSAAGEVVPAGEVREVKVGLPPGFLGAPLIMPRCPQDAIIPLFGEEQCPQGHSTVGTIQALLSQFPSVGGQTQRVYNNVPPFGYPAQFTGQIATGVAPLLGSVRSGGDYSVEVASPNIANAVKVYGAAVILEGRPGDSGGKAFLINPTSCAEVSPVATIEANTWHQSGVFDGTSEGQPQVTDCQPLTESWLGKGPEPKQPSFEFQPTVTQGSSGTGATAKLHINQEGLTDPAKLATSHLKKTVVALPPGLSLNPSAANGLEACSESQIGFKGSGFPLPNPIRFDEEPAACPDGSKLGTVEATSPLLEEPVGGTLYLATQDDNPFNSLIALYLVIDSPRFGLNVKLPGKVEADPVSGQLTATFDYNPQLPVEDLTLHFRGGGPRSQLATPEVCGNYKSTGSLTPWSAENGESAPIEEAGFSISSGCAPTAAARPFAPSFQAGTLDPFAGAFSPLVIKLGRKDGEQELTSLDFTLPPGLSAKLAGVSYCPEAAIAAAQGRTGKEELASPSCPPGSELGTVDTAAGVGSEPIHVGGRVYLAGPYKGAPLSSVVITPAVAGPFDLGNVVVRAPLYVNPETAQITAKSDPIPTILAGIPLKVRSVEIVVGRSGFSLNPTSCEPMTFGATMGGGSGATATGSSRFQVGGCSSLPFKPQLSLRVIGKTNRNAKPRFKAVLTAQPGEANIARTQVNLPRSLFLEQNNIRTICTRVQFAQGNGNGSACPPGSVYGFAKAWSPLLAQPLEGPVVLRANGGERDLPDLVAAIGGQISVALWAKIDSGPNGGLRNTFEVVPDAPVSRFVLEMRGAKKGLLVNSENLCSPKAKTKAIVRMTAHNGAVRKWKPKVKNQCKKGKSGNGKRGGAG